ncbi:hypothetical protein OG871_40035 (plasmid) [Kitasatospora sp. NBC_00374]|uniref:hypothetical protein n=1 Tax=Kitasatospora sp. NBC_00374 TaxID=2975964 RepID=UPI002F919CA7
MRLNSDQELTIQRAAEQIAALTSTTNGYGVRSSVQARAILTELDRQGLLDTDSFGRAFASTSAPAPCVDQVRQFVTQVIANRQWLLTG